VKDSLVETTVFALTELEELWVTSRNWHPNR